MEPINDGVGLGPLSDFTPARQPPPSVHPAPEAFPAAASVPAALDIWGSMIPKVKEEAERSPPKQHQAKDITKDATSLKMEYCPHGEPSSRLKSLTAQLRQEETATVKQESRTSLFKNLRLLAIAATIIVVCAALLAGTFASGGLAAPIALAIGIGIGSGFLTQGLTGLLPKEENQLLLSSNNKKYNKFLESLSNNYVSVPSGKKKDIDEATSKGKPKFALTEESYSELLKDAHLFQTWKEIEILNPHTKEDHEDLSDKTKRLDDLLAYNHNLYRINEKVDDGDRKVGVEEGIEVDVEEVEEGIEAEEVEEGMKMDEEEVEEGIEVDVEQVGEAELKEQVAEEHDTIQKRFYMGMASFLDKQYFSYPRTESNHDSYNENLDLLKERLKKRTNDDQLNRFDSNAAEAYLSKLKEEDMKELFIIISTCKQRGEPIIPTADEDKALSKILSRIGLHKIPPRSASPP